MWRTCMSTVRVLSTSSLATSRFVRPDATKRITSSSRRERPAFSWSAAARRPSRRSTDSPSFATSSAASRGQRRGAEAARRDVRLGEPLGGGLALARRGERHPRAELDLCSLERDLEARVQLGRAAELLRGGVRMALGERRLAECVRERGQGVRVAGPGRDARQRLGARARLAERAVAGEEARSPAKAPDRVVVVLAALPALQHEAAVRVGVVEIALVLRQPGERGGAVHAHRDDVEARGRVQALDEQRPSGRPLAAERTDRPEHAVRDQRRVRARAREAQLVRELRRRAPSRPARAARRPCS